MVGARGELIVPIHRLPGCSEMVEEHPVGTQRAKDLIDPLETGHLLQGVDVLPEVPP